MAYYVYLDKMQLPVTPEKITLKINNNNKTVTLINDGEINILKSPGLTDISFDVLIPAVKYPFASYPSGFKDITYYLGKIEALKTGKKTFQFVVTRTKPNGVLMYDTNMKVSLEDYNIEEGYEYGLDVLLPIKLKQYSDYSTKTIKITTSSKATVSKTRASSKKTAKTYKVKRGDCLWNIAKKQLGKGSRWREIYNLNKSKIKNPNLIYPGQVFILPS